METMRIRAAGSVARICTVDDLRFGCGVLPKDSLVMAASWLAGRDETFWNTGVVQSTNLIASGQSVSYATPTTHSADLFATPHLTPPPPVRVCRLTAVLALGHARQKMISRPLWLLKG